MAGAAVIPGGMVLRSTSWTRTRRGPFTHNARGRVARGADAKALRGDIAAFMTPWVLAAVLFELGVIRKGSPHVATVLGCVAGIVIVLIDGNGVEGFAVVVASAATVTAVPSLLLLVLAFVDCFGNAARAAALAVINHGCFEDIRGELGVDDEVNAEIIQIKIGTKQKVRWKRKTRGLVFSLFPLELRVS